MNAWLLTGDRRGLHADDLAELLTTVVVVILIPVDVYYLIHHPHIAYSSIGAAQRFRLG